MRYVFFLFAAVALADIPPLPDEGLRMNALAAIFPGMQIALAPGKHIDDSWPDRPQAHLLNAPDALATENVYRVAGGATNEAEKQASAQLITGKSSTTRLVRFQIFPWPDRTGLLAVLQYNFEGAVPSMACPSIGLLVQLARENGRWEVKDRYLLETMHHFSLKTVRMLNLTGDPVDQLVIESDFGGADTWGTNFMIFEPGTKIEQLFETTSQLTYRTDDVFTQELDVPQTMQFEGKQVCFTKTTMFENGQPFNPPGVSHVCYNVDASIDRKDAEERNKLLRP